MKRVFLTALAVLILAAAPGAADEDAARARALPPPVLAALLNGYDLYQAGDYAGAIMAWSGAIREGPHRAQYLYARMLAEGLGTDADPAAAAALVAEAASHGHAEAQYLLGLTLWTTGRTTAGVKWLYAAANQNWPDAHYALAQVFEVGDGVELDLVEAYFRYGLAMKLGHPQSSVRAGRLEQRMSPAQLDNANARIIAATADR